MAEFYNGDRGPNYPKPSEIVEQGVPFINAGDLINGHIDYHNCKHITSDKFNQLNGAKLKINDIVYCLRGTIGKNGLVNSGANATIASSLVCIRPVKLRPLFLFQILNSSIEERQRKMVDEGAAQPNISATNLKKFLIPVPNDNEQEKIGEVFSKLNHLITLQQRKLKQLKRLKTAMLQQLFVEKNSKLPILRFKNFNGDWKQCKLGELVESLFQGINTAADKVEYSNNGLPIIQAKNITSGSLDFSGSRKLSVQKYSNYLDKYIPQKGDILFANIGTIGPNVILKDTRQFFIAWNILRIVPQKNINGEFLKITLDLLNSKHYFEKLLTGNATKFVNKNDMRNLPIFFSDPEEQNKISNLFKKLDFLITLQQNKLTQLSTLKKYLLQKMFI
ncbi:restriction endonuclease subunit S [Limosilactobacillus reuteri]|uniref:restriction endonuclease subunit S n=1 Tax=Limosilactobacillus reuteri TaxID=1598 RepID=UPI001E38435A|nr:restriction endonuclease subunit S [Limosilactobacillus reuteri]